MTKEPRGVIFIITRSNKFLVQLRDEHSFQDSGMWAFPGGKSDEGESEMDTVVREAKEETNLNIKKENCQLLMKRLGNQNLVFICKVEGKQEFKVLEGADLRWMTIEEIKQLELGYNQGDIIPVLQDYLSSQAA